MQYVTETTREAAYRWLVKLQESEIRKLRAVFSNSPSYADLTPVQYDQGLAWLRSLGLVTAGGNCRSGLAGEGPEQRGGCRCACAR